MVNYPALSKELHEKIKYDFNADSLSLNLIGVDGQNKLNIDYVNSIKNLAIIPDSTKRENKFMAITREYIIKSYKNIEKSCTDKDMRQKNFRNFNKNIQVMLASKGHFSFTL